MTCNTQWQILTEVSFSNSDCDRDFTNLFEMFSKSFEVIEDHVNDNFSTDYFEINFRVGKGFKIEIWHF